MTTKRKLRVAVLGFVIAGLLLPAGLAAGSHEEVIIDPNGEASVVLLTLGSRDQVTWNGLTQTITTRNNDCLAVRFAATPDLLKVTAIGGQLGEVKDGLGVRGPMDGAGEPCGRVSSPDQALSVSLGQALEGHLMTAVDLDLELKFNAFVRATYLLGGHQVHIHDFNPTSGPDDGPDSKDGDNYRYFHRPASGATQLYFDEVVLRAVSGAFALEGGADLSSNNSPNAFGQLDPSSKSSQFEVVPSYDGQITCQDTVVIDDPSIPGVAGEVTLHAMQSGGAAWVTEDCLLKPYNDGVTFDTLFFVPELAGTSARYTITITLDDQDVTGSPLGQITSLAMTYDPAGGPEPSRPLKACQGQPVLDGPGYAEFWTESELGLFPAGESACYYSVALLPMAVGSGSEIWGIFFEDDPSFGFK